MPTTSPVEKLLYTPREAAHALGLSRSTIYVLMENGDLPSVRIGASRRIPTESLRRYIARLAGEPADHRADASTKAATRRHRDPLKLPGFRPPN